LLIHTLLKNSIRHPFTLKATLLVVLFTGFALADQDNEERLKHLSLAQLGSIEVTTATKEPEEVARTPAAIYVLTNDDIRRSGATSIPEVLRLVPGVEVARIDSSTWAVGIRGFGSNFSKSVLVLIDGRSVYTPLFAGVDWKVQNVMLEDVDRIEVIRGPGGTIWGANAVNGVINIITRDSKDTRRALASVGGGNVDQGMGAFRYGGSVGENLSYRVYGMAYGRGPEFHANHDNFDSWQLGQAGFRIDWDSQSRDTLTVQGDLYKGAIGQEQNITRYSPPASVNVDGTEDESGGNILARWRRKLNGFSDIQVQGYYDRTYRLGPQVGETRTTFDLDFIHHLRLQRQDIIWGLGARWSPSDIIQAVTTVDFAPHHQSDDLYAVFVQDEFAIVRDKLSITVGSKFEHNIYTGWESQPSARLLYTPTSHQSIWVATTRAVRTPSRLDEDLQLTELAATRPLPVFLRIEGNPKFVSETLLGYEAGYRGLLSQRISVDVAGFYNKYDHLSSLEPGTLFVEPTPPPAHLLLPVVYGNGLKGTTTGFEIAPNWKPKYWLRLGGSYSYLHMDLRNEPGSLDVSTVSATVGSSPQHQGEIQSFLDLPGNVELTLAYRYVSALPTQQVDAYGTADIRLAWRASQKIRFSVVGQNLLQPRHAEYGGDPGPLIGIKRDIYASITWER
jgi:iron complex outermembrane receptor protein